MTYFDFLFGFLFNCDFAKDVLKQCQKFDDDSTYLLKMRIEEECQPGSPPWYKTLPF